MKIYWTLYYVYVVYVFNFYFLFKSLMLILKFGWNFLFCTNSLKSLPSYCRSDELQSFFLLTCKTYSLKDYLYQCHFVDKTRVRKLEKCWLTYPLTRRNKNYSQSTVFWLRLVFRERLRASKMIWTKKVEF